LIDKFLKISLQKRRRRFYFVVVFVFQQNILSKKEKEKTEGIYTWIKKPILTI